MQMHRRLRLYVIFSYFKESLISIGKCSLLCLHSVDYIMAEQ